MKPAPALGETTVRRVRVGEASDERRDVLAVEEPLEIRVGLPSGEHRAISITMRTPGEDAELAAGFLFTEGVLKSPDQIKQIRHCGIKIGKKGDTLDRAAALNSNTIRVGLSGDVDLDLKRLERNFYTTSSCGVCGKSSIEARRTGAKKLDSDNLTIDAGLIHRLPDILRSSQSVFDR